MTSQYNDKKKLPTTRNEAYTIEFAIFGWIMGKIK